MRRSQSRRLGPDFAQSAELLKFADSPRRRLGQAAVLSSAERRAFLVWSTSTSFPERNEVMARLSFECGLRATEIARVRWWMAFDQSWRRRPRLQLHATASKGGYGARELRIVPATLGAALDKLRLVMQPASRDGFVLVFRKCSVEPQKRSAAVQAFFRRGFDAIGAREATSHSGRRTAITEISRELGLKNAQVFAGHRSSATTARYEEPDYAGIDRVITERLAVRVPRAFRMARASLNSGDRRRQEA